MVESAADAFKLEPWHIFAFGNLAGGIVIAILSAVIVWKNKEIQKREIAVRRALRIASNAKARLEGKGLSDEDLEAELRGEDNLIHGGIDATPLGGGGSDPGGGDGDDSGGDGGPDGDPG